MYNSISEEKLREINNFLKNKIKIESEEGLNKSNLLSSDQDYGHVKY